ncbi:hypothetical protein K440DRAFT_636653 [Wilcoxina mikolae CBS 423.85]|nr:hypothetical protein K440DRAFT_636653 [Wilcoxina mikolae CBS 423.85]
MANSTFPASSGDEYCRGASFGDIVKFILLNYGLHALTALTHPGANLERTIHAIFLAVLIPYSGIANALITIRRAARFKNSPLDQALRAEALYVNIYYTNIHGQFPRTPNGMSLPEEYLGNQNLKFVKAPLGFTVEPPIRNRQGTEPARLELANQDSVIKIGAGIFQTVYGAFKLYKSRRHQFNEYGYTASTFTYQSMYVVKYKREQRNRARVAEESIHGLEAGDREQLEEVNKKIAGVVGYAYGDLRNSRNVYPGSVNDLIQASIEPI